MYPYYNPTMQQYASPQNIVRVSGENGARAYALPPNSSCLLLDENEPIVWLKTTDGAGYPSVTPYHIEPYTKPEPPSIDALIARVERLEGILNESNTESVESKKREQYVRSDSNGKRKPECPV